MSRRVLGSVAFFIWLAGCAPSEPPLWAEKSQPSDACFSQMMSDGVGISGSPVDTADEALTFLEEAALEGLERAKTEGVPHGRPFHPGYYQVVAQARVDAFQGAEAQRVASESSESSALYEARDPDGILLARYELMVLPEGLDFSQAGWVVTSAAFRLPPDRCARG